jgi:ABC-2 type transport system ATP-binding protein
MIEARGLSRSFDGRPAIEGLSFRVPEGALCALLGPNGAGKTTTVRVLLGLLPPSAGSAEVAGIRLPAGDAESARLRAQAGLLTETPGCYDRLSGQENLELFARLYGLAEREARVRSEHWLRRLGLWEARIRPFGTWSKGMKQRLALIRTVLHEPRVLFLDEPTSGLDPAAARDVRELVAGFRAEGRTILICTHNLTEAAQLADLVGILRRRMLAFGPPGALAGSPPGVVVRLGGADPAGRAAGLAGTLAGAPGVLRASAEGAALQLELADPVRHTPELVREIVRQGGDVLAVEPRATSLEEIYLAAVREDA